MSWGEMPTTQVGGAAQHGLERRAYVPQTERVQQPTTPERPKTPLNAVETIKQEAEQARALSRAVEVQMAANQTRLARADERFNRLGQSTDRPADVQAEYSAALQERDAIAAAQAHYLAEKTRLEAEYQPFQQQAAAVEQMKTSADAIAVSERRLAELGQENAALSDRLTAFETSTAARVAELQAEQQQLQQEQERRKAEYQAAIDERVEWCEQRQMYLPLAMNQDGSIKSEYKAFIDQYSAMKGWIHQAKLHIEEPSGRLDAIANDLQSIENYRAGLRAALDANIADITATEQNLHLAQFNYQQANQVQAEAVPQMQANIANRLQGRAKPLSQPAAAPVQPTWH